MISATVKLKLNSIQVSYKVADTVDKAFSQLMALWETEVKNLTPTVTGNLKTSIVGERTGFMQGMVATNVEYAGYVEFGTSRQAPRAMFRKGADIMKEKGIEFLSKKLKDIK